MRVLLASPRGFCAGVNMAIETLEVALAHYGRPVYVYHEIVHNKWVVERFRQKGAIFVDDLDQVPAGSNLLFSAHGVSPDVRRQAARGRLNAIDATCPLVMKVHREAVRFAGRGYTVVLIGHAGHDEVVGTMGEAPGAIVLVERPEDVDRLDPPDPEKMAFLAQTTLSVDDAAQIIARLRHRFPKIVGPPRADICYATQNRQHAVRQLAAEADMALVVGSPNSSNSLRLAEIARARCGRAYLIDGPSEIDPHWFSGQETVLVTAGASAPEDVVQEVVGWLRRRFAAAVEARVVREEDVHFLLPRPIREVAARYQGADRCQQGER
ncbi:MAG TPA: 4-hydroxy-3-methylbut-2-enyl diphosphate reductase [Planctomycetes bacterium]|nr:4-hydroxy-3-methylbut-2-enyl diphosphate reductase [Planctomycetota bacterium]